MNRTGKVGGKKRARAQAADKYVFVSVVVLTGKAER